MKWVHFPLHPDTPLEGRSLKEMYAERGWSLEEKNAQMKALMDAENLPYGFRTHTYNSRFAQELGAWADTQEGGEPVHDALYRAYFVDNRNLADIDVLMDVVQSVGLSVASARQAIEERTFKLAVDQDWEKSHAYGVTGVPTFVAAGYGLVGAQPYENLAQFIESVKEKIGSGTGAL
jgi:predicted DsbA family dithiol-disulfide isomerase